MNENQMPDVRKMVEPAEPAVGGRSDPACCVVALFKAAKRASEKSRYEVHVNGDKVGHVWAQRELSYRGSQGWNCGIRIRDYHPLRWKSTKPGDLYSRMSYDTRKQAVDALLNYLHNA